MKETRQPFTEHVTKSRHGTNQLLVWILVLIIAVLTAVSFALRASSKKAERKTEAAYKQMEKEIAALEKERAEKLEIQNEIATLKTQLADLEQQREMVTQKAKGLEDEMRADLESKDVTISKLQGKLTVNIVDRVMFDSGEATLKPGGEAVMNKIATLLEGHPELKIHVIGHTDNIPIRSGAHNRFASNWELSTARALAALHFLTDKAGVDPRRVGAVGYGEYRPIADNSTAEGRAKNRRIVIMILPDELVEADASRL